METLATAYNFLPDTHTSKETAYIISDYPYSFSLRTTMYIWIEHNKTKGYRVARQTINPKTGKENKPKYSTYSPFFRLYIDENNHIHSYSHDFYNIESYDKALSDGLFDNLTNPIDHEEQMRITLITGIRFMISFQGFSINGDTSKLKEPPTLTEQQHAKLKTKTLQAIKEVYEELKALTNYLL